MPQILLSKRYSQLTKSILAIFLISVVVFLVLLGIYTITRIQNILLNGGMVDKTALRGLSIIYQKNLFFISSEELEKTLLKENPQLQSVSVQKLFPNSVVLTTEPEPIVAALEMNEGYALLSSEGKIIKKSKQIKEGFPLIRYYQKLNYAAYSSGDTIQHLDLLSALHFILEVRDVGLKADTVDINGIDMLLFSIGAKTIVFTTQKNKEIQDYELDQIIRQFKIEGKDFKSLDLRFEKPIITF